MRINPAWKIGLALAVLYVVWGSTYLAMRVGVRVWPPFLLASARFVLSGSILLGIAVWKRQPRPQSWQQVRTAIITGIALLGIANGLVAWSLQWVQSGTTALIIASTMLWMSLFEALRPGGERLSVWKVAGGLLGLAGVAVLMLPKLHWQLGRQVFIGEMTVTLASIIWAAGSIYSRHKPVPRSTFYNAGIQMLAASAFQALVAAGLGEFSQVTPEMLRPAPIAAILYLVLFGACIGFTTFTWLMQKTSPALTATYSFVNPVVAVILGVLLLDETVSVNLLTGGGLVLVSVLLLWSEKVRQG